MKKKLHILVYSESPCYGGAEEYVYHLAAGPGRNGCRFGFVHDRTSRLGGFTDRLREIGVAVETLPRVSGKSDYATFLEHVRYFRRTRSDVLHFNQSDPYSQQYTVLAARLAGVRNMIATYHLTPRRRTRTLRGRLLEQAVLRSLCRVIVLSRQNREEMIGHFRAPAGRISIVPNGLDTPAGLTGGEIRKVREEMGAGEGRFLVAAAGRLTVQKGFEHLIRALELLDRSDVRAVIAGEGPLKDELERSVRERGLSSGVALTGFREDVWKIFCAADAVVIPSLYEGLPLVLIEAMAAGKPVIASNIYGLADVVRDGETGFLVEAGSHTAIARALERLLDDTATGGSMGAAARRLYEERYTARNFHERMMQIYHAAAGKEGGR